MYLDKIKKKKKNTAFIAIYPTSQMPLTRRAHDSTSQLWPLLSLKSNHILNKVGRQSINHLYFPCWVLLFFYTSLVNNHKDQVLSFSTSSKLKYNSLSRKFLVSPIMYVFSRRKTRLNATAYVNLSFNLGLFILSVPIKHSS